MRMRARPAGMGDLYRTFRWINDLENRTNSFSPEFIDLAVHRSWLQEVLSTGKTRLWIVQGSGDGAWTDLAQVRVDSKGVVSLVVGRGWRGRGLASAILKTALSEDRPPGGRYLAYIKPGNRVSVQAFKSAGFKLRGRVWFGDQNCLEFVRP